jgi:hypothetical protein
MPDEPSFGYGECGCGGYHVKGRACLPEMKRAAVERLLAAWEKMPTERLGQLLLNASEFGLDRDLFYVEDDEILEVLERRAQREGSP